MNDSATRTLAMSYLDLRRAIGVIGIALPFVLLVGKLVIDGPGLPGSISAYYYTDMRNVLVGAVFAIASFLVSYRYGTVDAWASTVAGIAAIGLALFPTAPADPTPQQRVIGAVHLVSAGVFFLTLAAMALFLFTRTDPAQPPTPQKRQRNVVYRVCGILIVGSLVLAVLTDNLFSPALVAQLHPVFWLESVAIVAFGVSWLVKGRTILQDPVVSGPGTGAGRGPR